MGEWIRKFIWKLRAMWIAADMVYESQRNVLGMTVELAREVEKRIKLKKENATLKRGLADIGYSKDMTLEVAQNKAKRLYEQS